MPEADAQEAFLHGVAAVDPTRLVKARVRAGGLDDRLGDRERPRTQTVLALGKAAARMVWGLVEANVPLCGLGVHPGGVAAPQLEGFRWLRGEHPVPGDGSLAAGEAVRDWLGRLPPGEPLLVLLSGGASSVVERPRDGVAAADLVAAWREDLRAGLPIADLNARRAARSSLKTGGLAARAGDRPVRVWCLSDVPPDRVDALGSGPFWDGAGRVPHEVLADNDAMVRAAGAALQRAGYAVYRHGARVAGDAGAEAEGFVAAFATLPGDRVALVGGGEAVVALPEDAPPGGRCQHAALAAARALAQRDAAGVFLAGASDGRDGGTDVAMAWADAGLWRAEPGAARAALEGFDAARFLGDRDRTVSTGPTGTNVADLWVLLR